MSCDYLGPHVVYRQYLVTTLALRCFTYGILWLLWPSCRLWTVSSDYSGRHVVYRQCLVTTLALTWFIDSLVTTLALRWFIDSIL